MIDTTSIIPDFSERMKKYKKQIRDADIKGKLLGIPYGSDGSLAIAAAFKAAGFDAEVMLPTCTKQTYEYAEKYVNTQVCEPFRVQVGDVFNWVNTKISEGYDPKDIAVMQPTAGGPCRLGQYPFVIRDYLDENGYEDVMLCMPSSVSDYSDLGLPKKDTMKLVKTAFKSMFATEILYNALLRIRPYEDRPFEGEQTEGEKRYKKCIDDICWAVENHQPLGHFMKHSSIYMGATPYNKEERYPIALIGGEFFMRIHERSNHHISKVLERDFNLPLETMVAPAMEWFNYVNSIRIKEAWEERDWINLLPRVMKKAYTAVNEWMLWRPFTELLKGREMHNAMHYVKAAERDNIYHSDIQGESPISIGLVYEFMNGYFQPVGDAVISGICHVGPHQCMQETVATSESQALIDDRIEEIKEKEKTANPEEKEMLKEKKVIPYVDVVFSHSPTPQWKQDLASFVKECYQKRDLILSRK